MAASAPKLSASLPPVDIPGTGKPKSHGGTSLICPSRPSLGLPLFSSDDAGITAPDLNGINSRRSGTTLPMKFARVMPTLSTMILKFRACTLADIIDEILAFLTQDLSAVITGLLAVTEKGTNFHAKLVLEGEYELLNAIISQFSGCHRLHDIEARGSKGAEADPIGERFFSDFSVHLPTGSFDPLEPHSRMSSASSPDSNRYVPSRRMTLAEHLQVPVIANFLATILPLRSIQRCTLFILTRFCHLLPTVTNTKVVFLWFKLIDHRPKGEWWVRKRRAEIVGYRERRCHWPILLYLSLLLPTPPPFLIQTTQHYHAICFTRATPARRSPANSATKSPLGQFRKLRTLQANDNKFVFKVNDISNDSLHILKETTCLRDAEKKR